MRKKKIPMRKCIISNEMRPKKDMIRVVINKEGEIFADATGKKQGRGAYVSKDVALVEKAQQREVLEKEGNATKETRDPVYKEIMTKMKIFNLLGLAMRAGKIKSGESVILNELKKNQIKLVILASDASSNTLKQMNNKCNSYQVPLKVFGTRNELGLAIGKSDRVNIGITDNGFAKKLLSMIDEYGKE